MRGESIIFRNRLLKFQQLLRKNGIDAAVIRALSTFTYFPGTRWFKPSLFVPSEGESTIFVVEGEADEFILA